VHPPTLESLTSAETCGRDEKTGVFAGETTSSPLLACLVQEGLPLRGKVAVTGGDAKEETVVFLEDTGIGESLDFGRLGRGVHLGKDFLGEGLFNSRGPLAGCVCGEPNVAGVTALGIRTGRALRIHPLLRYPSSRLRPFGHCQEACSSYACSDGSWRTTNHGLDVAVHRVVNDSNLGSHDNDVRTGGKMGQEREM
jgi:hypothetical protein